jgi:thiol-disulfide isomerase/thioredoxin
MNKLVAFIMILCAFTTSAFAELKITPERALQSYPFKVSMPKYSNEQGEDVYFVLYSYEENSVFPKVQELRAKSSPNGAEWFAEFDTSILSSFAICKAIDMNYSEPIETSIPILLYDRNGAPVKSSAYLKSLYDLGALSGAESAYPDYDLAVKDLELELLNYKANKQAQLAFYSLKYDLKQIPAQTVDSCASAILKTVAYNDEKTLESIIKAYNAIGKTQVADSLTKVAMRNFPTGSISESEFLKKMNDKKDATSYTETAELFLLQFSNSKSKAEITERAAASLIKEGNYDKAESFLEKNNYMPPTQALYLAFIYLEKLNNRTKAESIFNNAINALKNKAMSAKPSYVSYFDWNEQARNGLAETYRAFGQFYMQLKERDSSLKYLSLAKSEFASENTKIYEDLATAYYRFRMDSLAFASAESAILLSTESKNVKEIHKKLYDEELHNNTPYAKYYENLEYQAENNRLSKLNVKRLNKRIEMPVLMNVDELMVDLSLYKGEVLVVEFFSSWCEPCENSFSSLVDLSKRLNEGVKAKFFAIDVWEKEKKNPEVFRNGDFGKVKIFFDDNAAFARKTGIKGLPTRLFFDKNGTLQFAQTGSIGKDTDLQETMDIMKILVTE